MADSNRIALVTGANKGIGLEIARQLAQAGVFVIIGARDPARGSAAVKDLYLRNWQHNPSPSTSMTRRALQLLPKRSAWSMASSIFSLTTRASLMPVTVRRASAQPMPFAGS